MLERSIWIGFDQREAAAYAVARHSALRTLTQPIPIYGVVLRELQDKGLYTRPMEWRPNAFGRLAMWDVISEAWQATEHANARWLVPHLAKTGWALFMDGDVLVRRSLARLFDELDPRFAAYCVKHKHVPQSSAKMDEQEQTRYHRKNWSSVIAVNCDHEANKALTVEMVNTLPGRDLHRLIWLDDSLIGELHPTWNYLNGISESLPNPNVIHFTQGTPDMGGYETAMFADEWRAALRQWAR